MHRILGLVFIAATIVACPQLVSAEPSPAQSDAKCQSYYKQSDAHIPAVGDGGEHDYFIAMAAWCVAAAEGHRKLSEYGDTGNRQLEMLHRAADITLGAYAFYSLTEDSTAKAAFRNALTIEQYVKDNAADDKMRGLAVQESQMTSDMEHILYY